MWTVSSPLDSLHQDQLLGGEKKKEREDRPHGSAVCCRDAIQRKFIDCRVIILHGDMFWRVHQ
jgi:hypothetical protein